MTKPFETSIRIIAISAVLAAVVCGVCAIINTSLAYRGDARSATRQAKQDAMFAKFPLPAFPTAVTTPAPTAASKPAPKAK